MSAQAQDSNWGQPHKSTGRAAGGAGGRSPTAALAGLDSDRAGNGASAGASRSYGYAYHRPALLVLLKERESHGYELAARLAELGFEGPAPASLYRMLRGMEQEGWVRASWDMTARRGPARRIYSLTSEGNAYLQECAPALITERYALGEMLERYRTLVQREGRTRKRGRQVLVVDPDRDVRHMLWALLEEQGWAVEEAADAQEALEVWAAQPADIVILEQRMPCMKGTSLARRLRKGGFDGPMVMYVADIDAEVRRLGPALDLEPLAKGNFTDVVELFSTKFEGGRRPRR